MVPVVLIGFLWLLLRLRFFSNVHVGIFFISYLCPFLYWGYCHVSLFIGLNCVLKILTHVSLYIVESILLCFFAFASWLLSFFFFYPLNFFFYVKHNWLSLCGFYVWWLDTNLSPLYMSISLLMVLFSYSLKYSLLEFLFCKVACSYCIIETMQRCIMKIAITSYQPLIVSTPRYQC
jgi:hypothetical protein